MQINILRNLSRTAAVGGVAACAMSVTAHAQAITNPQYVEYPTPALIQTDLSDMERLVRRNYDQFFYYPTPNGGKILVLANAVISDEQLLRAYNLLDFYLTDVPGSQYGADKSAVANAMAENGAVLVIPDGADGRSKTRNRALVGQPLYQLEFPVEGSRAYMENDYEFRDAGFEEIFHLVHDYGIGTKYTPGALQQTYQADIAKAMEASLEGDLWGRGGRDVKRWLNELRPEGSLSQEYIASVIDSYYGYWGAFTEAPGGMWGVYIAKTREEVEELDPAGARLMEAFFPPYLTYMARIDPEFGGIFSLAFDPDQPYTHKSQYLVNARLLGSKAAGLIGNAQDNIFIGNDAPNSFDGGDGFDVVQYEGFSSDYDWRQSGDEILVLRGDDVDALQNIEVLRFKDRDVAL